MSPIRMLCVSTLVSAALAVAGCGDDKGGGRTAKGRFGLDKDKQMASKSTGKKSSAGKQGGDLDGLSPELSMQRDLERLREREKTQARTVEEMRGVLAQGEDVVGKEEQKLTEIRRQITEYDSTMRRYETASARGQGDASYNVPASMYGDKNAAGGAQRGRNTAQANSVAPARRDAPERQGEITRAGYSRDASGNDYARSGARDEETLFNGQTGQGMYEAQPSARPAQHQAQPQAQGPTHVRIGGNEFGDSPFGGAKVGRPHPAAPALTPAAAPAARVDDEENIWNPPTGNLFSASASPSAPPTLSSARQNSLRPAPAPVPAVAAPAPSAGVKAAAAASAAKPAAQAKSAPVGDSFANDEVFTPDLFLSGGR